MNSCVVQINLYYRCGVVNKPIKTGAFLPRVSFVVEMSCTLPHPFTAVVAGPTGCGKTKWVLHLVDNAREMIRPPPDRIWYCYGEYRHVNFYDGLPDMNHEAFDGRYPTLLVVDDLMSETNQLAANIFTKISHHRNISILHLTQNMFDKNKFARTISLNAHYLVLFKNPRCIDCEYDVSDVGIR